MQTSHHRSATVRKHCNSRWTHTPGEDAGVPRHANASRAHAEPEVRSALEMRGGLLQRGFHLQAPGTSAASIHSFKSRSGFAALNICRPKSRERSSQTWIPRALFPFSSSKGEKVPMPIRPGTTAVIPPPTPLFAERGPAMPFARFLPPEVGRLRRGRCVPDLLESSARRLKQTKQKRPHGEIPLMRLLTRLPITWNHTEAQCHDTRRHSYRPIHLGQRAAHPGHRSAALPPRGSGMLYQRGDPTEWIRHDGRSVRTRASRNHRPHGRRLPRCRAWARRWSRAHADGRRCTTE